MGSTPSPSALTHGRGARRFVWRLLRPWRRYSQCLPTTIFVVSPDVVSVVHAIGWKKPPDRWPNSPENESETAAVRWIGAQHLESSGQLAKRRVGSEVAAISSSIDETFCPPRTTTLVVLILLSNSDVSVACFISGTLPIGKAFSSSASSDWLCSLLQLELSRSWGHKHTFPPYFRVGIGRGVWERVAYSPL
jgi:hypothetical protein